MQKKRKRDITVFVLLALYLSLIETLIPKPFPWLKIGLSNIVTIIVLEKYDKRMAIEVLLLRIVAQGMVLGTLFSAGFIISLLSGLGSLIITIQLFRFRKYLSLISISLCSAFTHNLIQLLVVYFLLFRNIDIMNRGIIVFVTIFLFIGCVSGVIIGFLCEKLSLRRKRD